MLRAFAASWLVCLAGLDTALGLRFQRALDRNEAYRSWSSQLEQDVERLVKLREYDTSLPVVATACNSYYAKYVPAWSLRLAGFMLKQQVIVALDHTTVRIAKAYDLPAVSGNSRSALHRRSGAEPRTAEIMWAISGSLFGFEWGIPARFSACKFFLPYLLLRAGFTRVIFSELDVFFFYNPLPLVDASTPAAWDSHSPSAPPLRASYVAMMNVWGKEAGNRTNTGFMQFQGSGAMHLLDKARRGWRKLSKAAKGRKSADETFFNELLHQELATNPDFTASVLPTGAGGDFSDRVSDVTENTGVIHLSWCGPHCKSYFLDHFYKGLPRNKTQALVDEYLHKHLMQGHILP